MQLTRRAFLKVMGVGAAAFTASDWFAALGPVKAASEGGRPWGVLIDTTWCLGCGMCSDACQERWGLSGGSDATKLSASKYTVVQDKEVDGEDVYVRRMCMHCIDPACASACPVGALHKQSNGPVAYDSDLCIGCRYCMEACPFQIPTYQWESNTPLVAKCWFCYDRLAKGGMPACAEACPTGATQFGYRDELLAEAHQRIKDNPDQYVDHVYGEHEIGGTSMLFLASVRFAELGFPSNLGSTPIPEKTWQVMRKLPAVVVGMGVFLGISYKLTKTDEKKD